MMKIRLLSLSGAIEALKGVNASHWLAPFLTLTLLLILRAADPYAVEIARLKGFDQLQRNAPHITSENIVLIDIDEPAVEAEGQWPWPRGRMAALLDRLKKANAGVIVLPILFTEPDRFGEDEALATAVGEVGAVVAQNATLFRSIGGVFRGVSRIGDPTDWLFAWPSAIGPIAAIAERAAGVGMTNLAPEADGVVRRMPLAINSGGKPFPSIVLEALRVAAGAPSWSIKTGAGGVIAVRIPRLPTIVTDPNARVWIRYDSDYPRYSAHGDLPDLKDRMVIVGLTAVGLAQIVATPLGERYVHDVLADTVSTVLSDRHIKRPEIALPIELVVMGIIGLVVIVLARKAPFWAVGLGILTITAGIVAGAGALWSQSAILGDMTMPILVVLIVGLHSGLNRFAAEYNQRLQIKKQFEHYLSPPLVRQLQKHPELLKLGGETKELTLLFCDIRGFTPISEQFKQDPQGLTKLINRFLTPMTWAIMERNGTIDKYMGDCIMAFWNAPLNVPQQQTLAVSAALEMQKRLEVLNAELLLENQMPISIGTGINSGLCVVGNMGADQRFDYSALGDAVNLAARLEGQSKEYGVTIIVSDNIAFNASAEFIFVELDVVAVKGKTEGVRIFTCIGRREEEIDMPAIDLLMDNHKKYLSFYRQQLWSDAEIVARSQAEAWPIFSEYYRLMGIRIDELRKSSLPLNWDGVFRANSK